MTTVKCSDCDTNNARTTATCIVCNRPLPVSRVRGTRISRVRGTRISRVRKNLRHP
ncbi:hypothetical protein [Streptomyces violascens]|uniref:hypothetical protein n=1 Tax=Streptomyces violascens TaxID=67381 RepID=UPI001678B140|nr:hypothetical protein [Streptomyces violascens]GGU52660.1 hypothetical protein GCM10010289_86020 [Streptomyces violascens]